jgi:ABC-type transporter lipoprotein component MlaA
MSIGAGSGIVAYDAHADELAWLEDASLDFYSALRSVYLQSRAAEIGAIQASESL